MGDETKTTAAEPDPEPPPAAAPAAVSPTPDFIPSEATGWIGVGGFLLGMMALNVYGPRFRLDRCFEGLIMLAFTAAPMMVYDTFVLREQAAGGPVDGQSRVGARSVHRVLVKLAGMLGTLVALFFLYWVFPEYRPSLGGTTGFYSNFFQLCRVAGPWAAALCVAYFFFEDGRQRDPHDGYWHFGRVVLFDWDGVDWSKVSNHARTWAVKGFFLPLMFTFLCNNLPGLFFTNVAWVPGRGPDFFRAHHFLHNFLFTIDLGFVTCGYLLTLRVVQSHVRSAEPTALGWLAALLCYQPFWTRIGDLYMGYWGDNSWDAWLVPGTPLYWGWGVAILFFESIFVWCSISFGLRFSNLTHRGIVRFGPYYFTRHPAYISKIIAFFLISVPCLDSRGFEQSARNCLMLGVLGFLYWVRAKTEERHLASIDPAYSIYSEEVKTRHRRWLRVVLGRFAPG